MFESEALSRRLLACLGDSSRFRIVLSLLEGDRFVTELAGAVGLSQSCTTRHLQYLEREGIVRGAREGKRVMFRLRSDRPRVRELLEWVTTGPGGARPGAVGGADIHTEPGGRSGVAGPAAEGPGRRLRSPNRDLADREVPPAPASSRPPNDRPPGGMATDQSPPLRPATPSAPGGDAPVGVEVEPPSPVGTARATEIEDWLL